MTDQVTIKREDLLLRLQQLFVRLGVLPLLLLAAIVIFTALSNNFLTSGNLINVARQSTYLAIVAMGQMLALLTTQEQPERPTVR